MPKAWFVDATFDAVLQCDWVVLAPGELVNLNVNEFGQAGVDHG